MYVTEAQLAKQIGKPNLAEPGNIDPRLTDCCNDATDAINDWCGRFGDFDPVPPGIRRIALSLAVDVWKQPDATFGIMGMGETGTVRVARDLVARYDPALIRFYDPVNGWGVA
jgi:hypothetical protein